jgi:hypothetical protein
MTGFVAELLGMVCMGAGESPDLAGRFTVPGAGRIVLRVRGSVANLFVTMVGGRMTPTIPVRSGREAASTRIPGPWAGRIPDPEGPDESRPDRRQAAPAAGRGFDASISAAVLF